MIAFALKEEVKYNETDFGIDKLIDQGVFETYYPLHDGDEDDPVSSSKRQDFSEKNQITTFF